MSILVPVILTLLVAIASTSTRVEAAGRDNVLIEKAGVVKQDLGVTKTDFDLMVTSDTQLILPPGSFAVINVNGGGNVRPTSVVGEGTRALTFEWDLSFAPDDTVLYAFSAIERRRNKFVVNAFFTPKQSPTDIPSLGWDVSQSGDVFLLNGYASAIHFDNLLFQLPSTLDVDALFVLIEGNPSGIAGFVTSGNVPAVGLDGAPGELLVAHFP